MTSPVEDPASEAAPAAPSRRQSAGVLAGRLAAEVLAVVLLVGAVGGLGLYLVRREAAEDLARRWLRERGVQGQLDVERLDADGFSASLRVGPERDPDLLVDRIEVDLGVEPAWSATPFKISTRAIRLVRPRLKARLDDRGLTFGRLDPTIREFLSRPDTGEPGPLVLVEDGTVRLYTPYGPLRLEGGGAADDGELVRLEVRSAPARLQGEGLASNLGQGLLRAAGRGGRLIGRATLPVSGWTGGGVQVSAGEAVVELDLPYPKGRDLRIDGPAVVDAVVFGERIEAGALNARQARMHARFDGRWAGALNRLAVDGGLSVSASAAAMVGEGVNAVGTTLQADDLKVSWTRGVSQMRFAGAATWAAARAEGLGGRFERIRATVASGAGRLDLANGGRASGPTTTRVAAQRFSREGVVLSDAQAVIRTDLSLIAGATAGLALEGSAERATTAVDGRPAVLENVELRLSGPAQVDGALIWQAGGMATAHGDFPDETAAAIARRVPLLGAEEAHGPAIAAALGDFDLVAPAIALTMNADGATVGLPRPAVVRARTGGELTVTATGGPVWVGEGGIAYGDVSFDSRSGGLPEVDLALAGWTLRNGSFSTDLNLSAKDVDAAPGRGVDVATMGRATYSGGRFSYFADGCAQVRAEAVEFGENDVTEASGRLCPNRDGPLIRAGDDGWTVRGRFVGAALKWAVAETSVDDAQGAVVLAGDETGLTGAEVRLTRAGLSDLAAETRYRPAELAGLATLRGGVWAGRFDLSGRRGAKLAQVDLTHETATGRGYAEIDGRGVTFAPDGLQPAELTPIIGELATDVEGVLDFTGRLDWTSEGLTSSGRLTTAGLDFQTPAGPARQGAADIRLTSLAPLTSAPGQTVTVASVESLAELTDLVAQVTLAENGLSLRGVGFSLAGGQVRLEDSLSIPFEGAETFVGTLLVEEVQLGELLEALNLGEAIELDAVVDGRVPFSFAPGRLRFDQGRLTARQSGRIEISRSALTGLDASAGAPAPGAAVNAVQEFAYQAMENLSFDSLEVEVNSLPEGRLGLLFRIKGRHDPEIGEEARVGWLEALRGEAFQRRIPLPKGTPVNLTLDTTLNFDELLQAWLDAGRRNDEGSSAVQAAPARGTP